MITRPPISTLFPYTTLFRSLMSPAPMRTLSGGNSIIEAALMGVKIKPNGHITSDNHPDHPVAIQEPAGLARRCWSVFDLDRKSTRLNSSHSQISYAVFCLKK